MLGMMAGRFNVKRAKNIIDIDINVDRANIVVLSDIHIPFHDTKAVKCALDFVKNERPDIVVLNGDILDMFMLSRFTKGEGRNPMEEITMCREFLKDLREVSRNADIYYVIGNHETRLEHYVLNKAPELASLIEDVFSIIKVSDFNIRGCASLTVNNTFVFKHGTLLGNKSGLSAIKEMENSYMSGCTGHCFADDVEILTPNGFINLLDVKIGELVGTYNKQTGEFEWNKVKEKFVYDNYKELYRLKSQVVDISMTDKHGLIGFNTYNNKLEEFTAEQLSTSGKRYNIPLACTENKNNKIGISEDMLRLIVNISADASIEDNSFRFHLRKQRKIDHLIELLNKLNLTFTVRRQSCGTTKIRLTTESSKDILNTYFPSGIKKLPYIFRCANKEEAQIILDEYSITDGCKNTSAKNSYQISTSKKEEADLIQEIFVKNGIRTTIRKRKSGNYCVTANTRNTTTVSKHNVTTVPYEGLVSCVSVYNGTLVVRSKGQTVVTQNTHRLCKYIARKAGRKFIWLESGCLCDLNPEYVVQPNWQQGFATISIKDGKVKHARAIEIENGEIV